MEVHEKRKSHKVLFGAGVMTSETEKESTEDILGSNQEQLKSLYWHGKCTAKIRFVGTAQSLKSKLHTAQSKLIRVILHPFGCNSF